MELSAQVNGPFNVVFGSLKISMRAFKDVYRPPIIRKSCIAVSAHLTKGRTITYRHCNNRIIQTCYGHLLRRAMLLLPVKMLKQKG